MGQILNFILHAESVDAYLAGLTERTADFSRPLDDLGQGGQAILRSNLERGEGAGGASFQALDPVYQREKDKRYGGEPILVASGAMRDSITYDVGPLELSVFPTGPKASFHASRGARSSMPLRDFLWAPEAWFDRAETLSIQHLIGVL